MAILFLILASETIMTDLESNNIFEKISLRLQRWVALLSLSLRFAQWKEKWLEKLSINLKPGENSLLRELKDGKFLLRWLFTSTIGLLILSHCLVIIFSKERQYKEDLLACLLSKRILITWFNSNVEVLIWCLPLRVWRCK